MLFFDLDRFEYVNDTLGHGVGDRLLQSVAQRLLACVRDSDTVSRLGGDEFVILLAEVTQAQDAGLIAEKILTALSAPHRIDEHDLQLTASVGIGIYPDNGVEAEILMRDADLAMYPAKQHGRNTYRYFKPEKNVQAAERQSIERGLRGAMERLEFVLHYQPKMNISTGAIVGAEALIRWAHPQQGLMGPAQFMPIAAECGLIVPITRWVLREACRQATAWQDAGLPQIRVAVNISAADLRAEDFVAGVRDILKETGLAPRFLELELTEGCLTGDTASVDRVNRALKDAGVQFALDNFGTGHSKLSELKRFNIDTLKIDRSFMHDLSTDADDASIVSAMINIGRTLGLRVVATGVETMAHFVFLREQGCPEGQGHYFRPAVTADKFSKLLTRRAARVPAVDAARRRVLRVSARNQTEST